MSNLDRNEIMVMENPLAVICGLGGLQSNSLLHADPGAALVFNNDAGLARNCWY